ncbi:MAG: dTDP-glucose 4,6-dehydratase [Planctomycetota bacterium]
MAPPNHPSRIVVTGGAGFIGSAVVRHFLRATDAEVLNFDKLTYAASLSSLREFHDSPKYHFLEGDICEQSVLLSTLRDFRPEAIIHCAAESHVDRSIAGPADFVHTNLLGTYTLLQATREYWEDASESSRRAFRFVHVSTDEVYGSLGPEGLFSESTPYDPRSPYSASKAGSDHLVMAWHHTYGLPVLITHCSNNYGPFQFPEKLVPLVILNAIEEKMLPIYGTGDNIRDWLHVDDHVLALMRVLAAGHVGQRYNIGGSNERTNLQVVGAICDILDRRKRRTEGSYHDLITFVVDRPGHDLRYAIDATKIREELGWRPTKSFETGLEKTVDWYLQNGWWWRPYRD